MSIMKKKPQILKESFKMLNITLKITPKKKNRLKQIIFFVYFLEIFLVMFMFYKSLTNEDLKNKKPLIQVVNLYLPIFILFIQLGFAYSLYIYCKKQKWTASPFNYPPDKEQMINFHVIPAFIWLFTASLQVYLISLPNSIYHRILGMCLFFLFAIFILTAIISVRKKLSPLGTHVEFMEWSLVLGSSLYLFLGIMFICLARKRNEFYEYHMIAMTCTIISSAGPGVFRVLRLIREACFKRLCKSDDYTNYEEVNFPGGDDKTKKNSLKNITNMHDVESTYFCLAFVITSLCMYVPFYLAGMGNNKFVLFCCTLPILIIMLSIFLGTIYPEFKFKIRFDYDFKTTKFNKDDSSFEETKRDQSNPCDRNLAKINKTTLILRIFLKIIKLN